MFKILLSYPIINNSILDILEKVSKPAFSNVPVGIGEKKQHKIVFDSLCFNDLGIDYRLSTNGHFILSGLQYWSTSEKWIDKSKGCSGVGLLSLLKHIHDNYSPLVSASGLFTF